MPHRRLIQPGTLTGLALVATISVMAFVACASPSAAPTASPLPVARPAAAVALSPTPIQPATITPEALKSLLDGPDKPLVVDSRSKAQYDAAHIAEAKSLPYSEMGSRMSEIPKDRLVVFYCSGGT